MSTVLLYVGCFLYGAAAGIIHDLIRARWEWVNGKANLTEKVLQLCMALTWPAFWVAFWIVWFAMIRRRGGK